MLNTTDLPTDVLVVVAKHLQPYDVLALSSTCKAFRQIFSNKSLWLHVAHSNSHSRPLPITNTVEPHHLDLPQLHAASLRSQRIDSKWCNGAVIKPTSSVVRLRFQDSRRVPYFAFLPGAKHLLMFDCRGGLSCWGTNGKRVAFWEGGLDTQLARWKPLEHVPGDDPEVQSVEIVMGQDCQFEVLWLQITGDSAKFSSVKRFLIPRIYPPLSIMTQDDIQGTLTVVPPCNVGVYLVMTSIDKSICIDTGLAVQVSAVFTPQALLSQHHMVLYWETQRGAETHAYSIPRLMDLINQIGVRLTWPKAAAPSGGTTTKEFADAVTRIKTPYHFAPDCSRLIPFETVASPNIHIGKVSHPMPQVSPNSVYPGTANDISLVEWLNTPSNAISRNRSFHAIIIPKWAAMYEDVGQHRVRSVLTMSRRVIASRTFDVTIEPGVDLAELHDGNGGDMIEDLLEVLDVIEGLGHIPGPLLEQHQALLATPQAEGDVDNNEQGDGDGGEDDGEDDGDDGDDGEDEEDEEGMDAMEALFAPAPAPPDDPEEIPDFQHLNIGSLSETRMTLTHHYFDFKAEPGVLKRVVLADVRLRRLSLNQRREAEQATAVAAGGTAGDGADVGGEVAGADNNGQPIGTTNGTNQSDLSDVGVLDTMYGGSPVIGFGGRCAGWVETEEYEDDRMCHHISGRRSLGARPKSTRVVIKVATFPSYVSEGTRQPPTRSQKPSQTAAAKEYDARMKDDWGCVSTLIPPAGLDLNNVCCLDLDDARGVIGVATMDGEVWLIDYS